MSVSLAPFYALPKLVGGRDVRLESLRLYKKTMRSVPIIVKGFGLNKTVRQVKDLVHTDFKNKSAILRLDQTELLLTKGYQDLEEFLEGWKTKYHVERFFDEMESNAKRLQQRRGVLLLDANSPMELLKEHVAYYSDKPWEEGTLDRIAAMSVDDIEKRIQEMFESRFDPILNDFMDGHGNEDDNVK